MLGSCATTGCGSISTEDNYSVVRSRLQSTTRAIYLLGPIVSKMKVMGFDNIFMMRWTTSINCGNSKIVSSRVKPVDREILASSRRVSTAAFIRSGGLSASVLKKSDIADRIVRWSGSLVVI
jgi:hypothetical protein